MGEMGGLKLHQTGPGTSVGGWLWLEDWNHVRFVNGGMQDDPSAESQVSGWCDTAMPARPTLFSSQVPGHNLLWV